MASIYGLYDADGNLRYIGKANNPKYRLSGHLREAFNRQRQTPVYDWIRKHGEPVMRILEADCEDWEEAERILIAEHRAAGANLLNLAEGGDQPGVNRETCSANGYLLNDMLNDDGLVGKVTRYKRRIGRARREGYLSNRTRDKLRLLAEKRPDWFGLWKNIPTMEEEYGCSYDTPEWFEFVKSRRWQKGKAKSAK